MGNWVPLLFTALWTTAAVSEQSEVIMAPNPHDLIGCFDYHTDSWPGPLMEDTLVVIEPIDELLVFTRKCEPEKDPEISATISIHNKHHDMSILFRIQTTNPMSYAVNPIKGRMDPLSSVSIDIVLTLDGGEADKFLVRYVVVDAALEGSFDNIIRYGGVAKEFKLSCAFPDGTEPTKQRPKILGCF